MIIYTRTFSLCSGKENEAVAYLVETAKWINEHYPGHDAHILTNIHGTAGQAHFVEIFASLAEMEAIFAKADTDTAWLEVAAKGQGLLENADVTIYRRVS